MIKPGTIYCIYVKPCISPIWLPIKLPKITKYKTMVIAGGNKVCGQIRKNRRASRYTMVCKAIKLDFNSALMLDHLPNSSQPMTQKAPLSGYFYYADSALQSPTPRAG